MPGIVGLVTRMPRALAEPLLHRMLAPLRHEPSYTVGTWVDESLGVYAGWVARQGAFAEAMPLLNERGDVALIFGGEEFSKPDATRALQNQGHEFDPAGPAYLVHMYEQDPTFPAGLNGTFHGLLADRTKGQVMLFNDRFGLGRIYHYQAGDAFYFAGEAKSILAVRPELRRLDPKGLGEFISCGCVLENRTLFEGLDLVPGGAKWIFQNGELERKTSYFEPQEWEDQPLKSDDAFYEDFRSTFSQILPRYFEGSERIGMSLTGGLDTRMIMAWQHCAPGTLPSYSFGGMFRECQDVIVARRVAQACGQSHHVLSAGTDFLSKFSHYAERTIYLTDGCADVSLCPDLYIYEQARAIAPVRMTGNLGGELLRQTLSFKASEPLSGLFTGDVLAQVQAAKATYARNRESQHPVSFAAFRQSPWHHFRVFSLEQTQFASRTPYLDNDLLQAVFRAPRSALSSTDVSLRLIADGNPALRDIPTDRGVISGPQSLATKVSRALLTLEFKAEYAYDYGMPQWLARADHAVAPLHLERLFLGRHKFYHFRLWYRDYLAGYVRDTLLSPKALSRSYLEPKTVEAIVTKHLSGSGNYTTEIHKLLSLELLHRVLIDS